MPEEMIIKTFKYRIYPKKSQARKIRSYYCESVGHISEETVQKYIKDQKNR